MGTNKITRSLSLLTKPIYGGVGHILMYHRVTPDLPNRVPGQAALEVTPQQFENTIEYFIQRNYEFISIEELQDRLENRRAHKSKFVLITFDDGYLDNLLYAYPILEKHQIHFTIYITTNFPDRTAIIWWYLLDELILSHDHLTFELAENTLELNCSSPENKKNASLQLRRIIKYSRLDTYLPNIKRIFAPYGIDLQAKTEELALSWEQIRQLSQDPLVTIGSHSMNHYILKNLPVETVRREIQFSKQLIENHIGVPVKHFAYPYGERNEAGEREFQLVKECGFETAVTTRFANIFPAHKHYMESLPRYDMPSIGDFDRLTLAINGYTPCRRYRFRRVITH
jgi:peptidoglycan/xylan/chitin deacetylase (PgdA/CDA1 family)